MKRKTSTQEKDLAIKIHTDYKNVFKQNKKWVQEVSEKNPQYFTQLGQGQNPIWLWIGCADSRVPAMEIMGLAPGEVFVHTNIANMVVGTNLSCQSVIHYAVEVLKVKHIVVCGHYGCGGIQAALVQKDMGLLNPWLREIRDVYRLHFEELYAISDPEQKIRRLVELNVEEQCVNVIKTAAVQKSWAENHLPIVHGWVFDVHTGLLKDLDIPFEKILLRIKQVYNIVDSSLPDFAPSVTKRLGEHAKNLEEIKTERT